MKKILFWVAIGATPGAWIADLLLLGVPAFRNGWWSLLLFALPLAALVLGWGPQKGKLGPAAAAVFVLGLGGWIASRTVFFNITGTPAIAVGETAPDFTLRDPDGKEIDLSGFTKGGNLAVLVFFRGKG